MENNGDACLTVWAIDFGLTCCAQVESPANLIGPLLSLLITEEEENRDVG
jgi:hypothetical protein